jgi:hypothetical protein
MSSFGLASNGGIPASNAYTSALGSHGNGGTGTGAGTMNMGDANSGGPSQPFFGARLNTGQTGDGRGGNGNGTGTGTSVNGGVNFSSTNYALAQGQAMSQNQGNESSSGSLGGQGYGQLQNQASRQQYPQQQQYQQNQNLEQAGGSNQVRNRPPSPSQRRPGGDEAYKMVKAEQAFDFRVSYSSLVRSYCHAPLRRPASSIQWTVGNVDPCANYRPRRRLHVGLTSGKLVIPLMQEGTLEQSSLIYLDLRYGQS